MDFYTVFSYVSLPFLLVALVYAWKYESSRYFLLLLTFIEIIDTALYKVSYTWTTHLYLYNMGMCLLFLVPIIYRNRIAYALHRFTGWPFFLRVYENHHFSVQEIGLILLGLIDFALAAFNYLEVWLYKFYVTDGWIMSNDVRNFILITLNILMCCGLLTYVFKTPDRERFYKEHGDSFATDPTE
ncbi:hypothetical protein L1285_04020 [Pseudoalteromonas sp. DL2-H2.2]|uniref:hypothetical protein n=1 Tax=Pseudoalteromonas sp. DL2-H2.2 TaxID=2908889 RepID=UPI001F2C4CF2|nr:hypothetical protein [Pseudoalteromonas sp. DL2-H2.2]MCF2907483.1 hypothetical protein [Pseudoalteromonas sp. DL2-H2.2]